MSVRVVDASVAIKWFFPEVHSEAALRLLANDHQLRAPDLIDAEFGNLLGKKWRRQALTEEEGVTLLQDFRRFPMVLVPCGNLLALAWHLATEVERPVLADHVVWIEEVP